MVSAFSAALDKAFPQSQGFPVTGNALHVGKELATPRMLLTEPQSKLQPQNNGYNLLCVRTAPTSVEAWPVPQPA